MGQDKVYKECSDLMEEKTGIYCSNKVSARMVLYVMSWSGFLVNFMMRNDINLTLVSMVKQHHPVNVTKSIAKEFCYYDEQANTTTTSNLAGYTGTLDWSSSIQSYTIAAFFWAYVPSQIVGGIFTQKFGTKIAFGYAQLFTALGSLCMPWAADIHYSCVILVRFIQGFASGFTWPAMYAAIVPWIPIKERSTFMSSFQGFSIGIGLTYPLCGFLIAQFGWRSVFYTTGTLGITWCIFWYFLVFDSPESHPRISKSEAEYIRANTEHTVADRKDQVIPWKSIVSSKPVWSIAITTFGRVWIHNVFLTMGPTYMKNILQFSIEKNGLINGAPFLICYLSAVMFCYIAGKLISNNIVSLLTCRRLMSVLSQVIPGVLIVLLTYLGCNIFMILIVWFCAIVFITAAFAGSMANVVDIAPNFSGPVIAFTQTIHMSASFISPIVSFRLLEGKEYLISAWTNVFNLAAVISIGTFLFYYVWGTAKVQEWNKKPRDDVEEASEDSKFIEKKINFDMNKE